MIPVIYASQPTIVPESVYDKWWVRSVLISALSPNGDAHARVELVKFRTLPDGIAEQGGDTELIEVDNLLASSADNPAIAAAVQSLMACIAGIAVERGIGLPQAPQQGA
jgi:hypothetical protein